jgi:hypothetical protein
MWILEVLMDDLFSNSPKNDGFEDISSHSDLSDDFEDIFSDSQKEINDLCRIRQVS